MNPLVSIVIPIYNCENYISYTIKSCLNQTYSTIEIILVNDGSTDNTEKIIKEFQDERIRYFKVENGGPCSARNFGISKANGILFQFLDHDDILDDNKVSSQVKYYSQFGEDYIYSCNMGSVSGKNKTVDVGYSLYYKDFKPLQYFKTVFNQFGKHITTGAWLVPSKVLHATHGWDSKAGLNDDGEYFMRLILQSAGIIYCKEGIFYFRRDAENSVSKQFNSKAVYENWLYSYISYVQNFVKSFDYKNASELGWKALSVYYCNSYPHYPDLLKMCKDEMKTLGYGRPHAYGGKLFRIVSALIGVENSLKVWQIKRGFDKKC